MKRVRIKGAESTLLYVFDPHCKRDVEVCKHLTLVNHVTQMHASGLLILDVPGVGRGVVRNDRDCHMLFEVHMNGTQFWRLTKDAPVAPPPEPTFCPHCGTQNVSFTNGWNFTDEAGSQVDLDEYQCRGECDGTSFWV